MQSKRRKPQRQEKAVAVSDGGLRGLSAADSNSPMAVRRQIWAELAADMPAYEDVGCRCGNGCGSDIQRPEVASTIDAGGLTENGGVGDDQPRLESGESRRWLLTATDS